MFEKSTTAPTQYERKDIEMRIVIQIRLLKLGLRKAPLPQHNM